MSAALSVLVQFFVSRFAGRTDRGATAVEYGLLVAGIAVAIIAAVFLLGTRLDGMFDDVVGRLPAGG